MSGSYSKNGRPSLLGYDQLNALEENSCIIACGYVEEIEASPELSQLCVLYSIAISLKKLAEAASK